MTNMTRDEAIARTAKHTQLLTFPQAAARLACSRTHVYRLVAAGKLRCVEIKASGTRPKGRVIESDLEDYITRHTETWPRPEGGGRGEVRRIDGT
jgi:excisionase family DNA binding protein